MGNFNESGERPQQPLTEKIEEQKAHIERLLDVEPDNEKDDQKQARRSEARQRLQTLVRHLKDRSAEIGADSTMTEAQKREAANTNDRDLEFAIADLENLGGPVKEVAVEISADQKAMTFDALAAFLNATEDLQQESSQNPEKLASYVDLSKKTEQIAKHRLQEIKEKIHSMETFAAAGAEGRQKIDDDLKNLRERADALKAQIERLRFDREPAEETLKKNILDAADDAYNGS